MCRPFVFKKVIKMNAYRTDAGRDDRCPDCNTDCEHDWHYTLTFWERFRTYILSVLIFGLLANIAIFIIKEMKRPTVEGVCQDIVLEPPGYGKRKCEHSQHILVETQSSWVCVCNNERAKEIKSVRLRYLIQ